MAAAGALALSAGSAFADATVSKNPADGADFDTIAAALASVDAGETVTVLDDAVYIENALTVNNRHLVSTNGATIQGRVFFAGAGLPSSLVGFTVTPNGNQGDALVVEDTVVLLVEDTVVDGTAASGSFTRDGMRILAQADVTLRNSSILGVAGAGFLPAGASNGFTLDIDGLTIDGTGSDGINFARTGTVTATGLSIANAGRYGILFNTGDTELLLTDSTITGSASEGIRLNGADLIVTLEGCTITGNTDDGIFGRPNSVGSTVTIRGGLISGNDAGVRTGIPWTLVVEDGAEISGNNNFGVAFIGSAQGSTGIFRDSTIANNNGNGLALHRSGDYTVEGMLVEGNAGNGVNRDFTGGDNDDTTIVVRDSIIRNNGGQGVVMIADGGNIDFTMEDCVVEGNGARCIWVDDKTFAGSPSGRVLATVQRNTLINNSKSVGPSPSDPDGPDVILFWEWNSYFWNTLPGSSFVNNVVDQGYAGVFVNRGSLDVHHNTIVNNREDTSALVFVVGDDPAPTAGIAIANILAGETVDIRNNILANSGVGVRTAPEPGFDGNPPSASSIDGTLVVDYNLTFARPGGTELEAGLPGVGLDNILGADPAFIAPSTTAGAGNYSIFGGSPAVNAGTDLGVLEDILGNERPLEGVPDMGAYEVMSDPSTVGDWSLYSF